MQMPFFGRKRKEENHDLNVDMLPMNLLEDPQMMMQEPPKSPPPVKREMEKPTVAPLFVKMDRYRQILTTIGNLKTALMITKNSLSTLQQIEKIRDETFGIVNDIVERMDEKLIMLDNDLLRPAGFHDNADSSAEEHDIRSIEATVSDLQGQIEQLKSEIGKMVI